VFEAREDGKWTAVRGEVISSTVVGNADGATEGDVEIIATTIRNTNYLMCRARYLGFCKVDLELV
jgi:hypothetical protein